MIFDLAFLGAFGIGRNRLLEFITRSILGGPINREVEF